MPRETWEKNRDHLDPWVKLFSWTPGFPPEQFTPTNDFYSDGDENSPFFSETFLYTLLGKEDARTLLALMRKSLESVGIDMIELEKRTYA